MKADNRQCYHKIQAITMTLTTVMTVARSVLVTGRLPADDLFSYIEIIEIISSVSVWKRGPAALGLEFRVQGLRQRTKRCCWGNFLAPQSATQRMALVLLSVGAWKAAV